MADEMNYYLSLSGGKDSLAAALYLQEQDIPYTAMFFDTGWEHPLTYRYLLDYLPSVVGPIEWVTAELPQLSELAEKWAQRIEELLDHPKGEPSGFVRHVLHNKISPGPKRRYCTRKLKIDALKAAFRKHDNPHRVNVVGIRAAESVARSKLSEREISTSLDCMVWRPLIKWTEKDVIDIHHRHNVRPNPLYLRHSKRVGCFPCIFANKADLKVVNEDPTRVKVLIMLEEALTEIRLENGGQFGALLRRRVPGRPDAPIQDVLAWSKTSHGGRQVPMFDTEELGCVSWGLCER